MRRRVQSGVTLLELLGVIALIGILAAILLPALARAREAGRRASCFSNLSQMGTVLWMYADEHQGHLPWSGGGGNADALRALQGDYVTDVDLLVCPSDSGQAVTARAWEPDEEEESDSAPVSTLLNEWKGLRASYDYMGAYAASPIVVPAAPAPLPPNVALMWDIVLPERWKGLSNHVPRGGNVLWLDGSVTFRHAEEWEAPGMPAVPTIYPVTLPDLVALLEPPEPEYY